MRKANQFLELIKQAEEKQLEKQKRIQDDIRISEEALDDLYIRIQNSLNKGTTKPKYADIPKILEKEAQDYLVMEQNYLIDITSNGHTHIYYDKNDFNNRIKNNRVEFNNKSEEKIKKTVEEKFDAKEYIKNKLQENDKLIEKNINFKGMPITVIGDQDTIDIINKLNSMTDSCKKGWCR